MHHYPLAQTLEEEYNSLYPDEFETADSTMEYASQLESRMNEISDILRNCHWAEDEREKLLIELQEIRLTYYELKILMA